MTMKKEYPGGVKLTLKTARAVAVQEFGTAKGLEKEEVAMPGYFKMKLGNLFVRIHPDTYDGTGCIVVSAELAFGTGQNLKFLNPDTLQDDFDAQIVEARIWKHYADDPRVEVMIQEVSIEKT